MIGTSPLDSVAWGVPLCLVEVDQTVQDDYLRHSVQYADALFGFKWPLMCHIHNRVRWSNWWWMKTVTSLWHHPESITSFHFPPLFPFHLSFYIYLPLCPSIPISSHPAPHTSTRTHTRHTLTEPRVWEHFWPLCSTTLLLFWCWQQYNYIGILCVVFEIHVVIW